MSFLLKNEKDLGLPFIFVTPRRSGLLISLSIKMSSVSCGGAGLAFGSRSSLLNSWPCTVPDKTLYQSKQNSLLAGFLEQPFTVLNIPFPLI